jgi:hypothetical protein
LGKNTEDHKFQNEGKIQKEQKIQQRKQKENSKTGRSSSKDKSKTSYQRGKSKWVIQRAGKRSKHRGSIIISNTRL